MARRRRRAPGSQDRYDGKDKELIHKLSSVEQNMAEAPFIKHPCIKSRVKKNTKNYNTEIEDSLRSKVRWDTKYIRGSATSGTSF